MKDMKELEKMDEKALAAFIEEKRTEVQSHRFGTGGRNVAAARTAKTEIARAMTLQTARAKEAQK